MMKSNENVKGRAIFSSPAQVKKKSLKVYSYLTCIAHLRNAANKFGDNVRIFQQRDIVLSKMEKEIGMDRRTIKKAWAELEEAELIRFCPKDWKEDGALSFDNKWKIRNKHKDTYYEIPRPPLFRKIPKETLLELNEIHKVSELTMKIYITLANYQEDCIINGLSYKRFTYKDIQTILGYAQESAFNRKVEAAINQLAGLGLLSYSLGNYTDTNGHIIPVYILNSVNFYTNYKNKEFKTGDINVIQKEQIERIKEENKENYDI